jgi:3-oxoadipate enol-lactonase
VVLLHGYSLDKRMWQPNAAALVRGLRVTVYDDRGAGPRFCMPTEPWSQVDDLLALLDALGVDRAALVGSSDGGRLALDFAVEHPGRVAGLVISGTAVDDLPEPDEQEQAALGDLLAALQPHAALAAQGDLAAAVAASLKVWGPTLGRAARDFLTPIMVENLGRGPDRTVEPRALAKPGISRLGEITTPTLVLVGDRDVSISQLTTRRIAAGIVGAEFVVVPGTDHFLNAGAPDEFNRLVGDFCQRITPVGG